MELSPASPGSQCHDDFEALLVVSGEAAALVAE